MWDDEDENDDALFVRQQYQTYRVALGKFRVTKSYWKSRIPEFASYTFVQKHTEIRPYEAILFGLDDRPWRLSFDFDHDPDELEDFCNALVIAWRLLPDAWTGLLMMVDYLADKMLPSDLRSINHETISVVTEIAQHQHWPNNPLCGPMFFCSQARSIMMKLGIRDAFTSALYESRTTTTSSPPIRANFAIASTPNPVEVADRRHRRSCSYPSCSNVETQTAFKRCNRCRKTRYCSEKCKTDHWKDGGHKQVCVKRKRK